MIVPFEKKHLLGMLMQDNQKECIITDEIIETLLLGDAYSAIYDDEVLACAGVLEISPGRALAWAYLSQNAGIKMIDIIKAIKRFLSIQTFRRIEMDVDCAFAQAHRMAKMLGFTLEAERRRNYTPDGRDCALYALVR